MASDRDKSLPTLASELWAMVLAYLKQETVVPIKGLGRFIAVGLVGSFTLGVGLLLLSLALLRALQTETTTFSGNWSWAPYAITLVASALVAVLAARAVTSQRRRATRKGSVAP
ncbi:MAG TPA: hypothetical protein VK988_04515 [Acidimicrobiales bacterium]|jgi:hypothetical protein|nr:hypothetical protein [Acidimicrobiales bacterium]